ncbi:MAG: TSUP family transporter [Desulfobacteraceae bacterium]|jgi:uncharacterized membrane protein YfcA
MLSLSLSSYVFLWFAGLFAGFVDSIAGGGGLIALPALLAAGLPPHMALGTNKLQSSFGSLTAAINYTHKGLVNPKHLIGAITFTAIGALIGTITIQFLPGEILRNIIPIFLTLAFIYLLVTPNFGLKQQRQLMSENLFFFSFGLLLGFYDGFFGPGTGSFWAFAFVTLLGLNLSQATAHTKITNFTSNAVSLTAFALGDNVVYSVGIIMGLGQGVGAYLGSRVVIYKGARLVRILLITVIGATICKLIYDTYMI